MSRFNQAAKIPALVAAVQTERTPSTTTAQGGDGYRRDTRSELLLLGVTNMVGQRTFYEEASARDSRYADLIRTVAGEDGGLAWLAGFLPWLRTEANLRTAPFVGAAHLVAARRGQPDEGGLVSGIVDGVLQRPDEPGELLAFWEQTYGGTPPKALKRGLVRAVVRLYTEGAALKYDTPGKLYRFGRVLDICHPTRDDVALGVYGETTTRELMDVRQVDVQRKRDLFGILGKRMRGKEYELPESLLMMRRHREVMAIPVERRRQVLTESPQLLREAGMDWQAAASWLNGPLDAAFWEAMIPSMKVQALVMNLRNFDKAGISAAAIDRVCSTLTDSQRIQRSRILPMQLLSAYRATANSLNWGLALNRALEYSLANIPEFDGNTLIMVDTSTSMNNTLSDDGELQRWDAAVIFAVALARRCAQATVVSFSSTAKYWGDPRGAHTKVFPLQPGESLLKSIERWENRGFFLGGGTDTALALRKHYTDQFTRVMVLTDEQADEDQVGIDKSIPAKVPMITLNLAGYEAGHAPAGTKNRVAIGGFNDAAFKAVGVLDRTRGRWPWEIPAVA